MVLESNKYLQKFEDFAKKELTAIYPEDIFNKTLLESMLYSFQSGGKRFRPSLVFAATEALGLALERSLGWALAIEMIHTYSLIHDDLPCMDDDDVRRGKPTNHKVYGESIALLSGDALLTEAFTVIAKQYESKLAPLILELTEISGLKGMIGGQFLDMEARVFELTYVKQMHLLKTGALISGCFSGPAILAQLTAAEVKKFKNIGLHAGFLFQVKDDVLDFHEKNQELKSVVPHLGGVKKTENFIEQETKKIIDQLSGCSFIKNPSLIVSYLTWNYQRDH
ncbi:MAG: polyprenyl synthetase family protein [Bacteriovoracaceae bacterium]|nr:polyprenyl synthetase family protein [Bacteriovoracaceae bacterium]NUM58128.1 polyprenyl synthetase family protein [Pseudobdellovibrionaceae bacterium]